MKNQTKTLCLALIGVTTLTNCTTTYDAYGNPQQSVDPTMAAVGVVAAGLIGAAIANNNNDYRNLHHHRRFRRGRW